ncbi:uncharacterized protein LOC114743406 [Neltuma alba]|uniref:uncharacterized protein LOC114743406 n=1 Tax=Neltuma alba TaxID=207710 RepID=UPI0010A4006B|nr:uncharacterized protein LOC114743406 [Prosopis alba]
MAIDPNSTTASAAATTVPAVAAATTMAPARPLTSPPPLSRPISQLSQPPPIQLHNSHLYPSQPFYAAQSLPIRAQNPHSNSQLSKAHDSVPQGVLYPVASSGRGFIPKGARPLSTDQMVTVANPGVYPPPHSLVFPPGVRPMGSPHLDYHLSYPLHLARPPNMQYAHPGLAGGAGSGPFKGVPVSAHPKVAPRSTNGYKDTRLYASDVMCTVSFCHLFFLERSKEDAFILVRDRKVRITEDPSLYALCRSWLKNGVMKKPSFMPRLVAGHWRGKSGSRSGTHNCVWFARRGFLNKLQQEDVMKVLPKPLSASVVAGYMENNKEDEDGDKQEEEEKINEQLSSQDLLKGHIQRAKKVRARLREERLQRITRYRSRLRLLLPPSVDQLRNDAAAGN